MSYLFLINCIDTPRFELNSDIITSMYVLEAQATQILTADVAMKPLPHRPLFKNILSVKPQVVQCG